LQSGTLSVVATDHCSFTVAQKRNGLKNFTMIPNGTGGLEDRMPVLWNAGVNSGRLTKEEFVAATSTNIAKILNMYPQKGVVRVGSDADIVVWDPKATKTITAAKQISRIEYNVFEGYVCTGAPKTVLSRGRVAWDQGDMRAKPGDGDFVARKANAPVHVANAIWKGVTQPQGVRRVEVTP
jgi:dihydropyrimidinase